MNLTVSYEFLPKTPSVHAALVMDHFGVGFDAGRHVIAENLELPIQPGDVVLFTGASGSGKSSLLRAAAEQLRRKPRGSTPAVLPFEEPTGWDPSASVLDIESLDLGERILVDGLNLQAEETFALLTSCGLGEARLMLRSPQELSDGQRYRYRLALAFSQSPHWIVADEFTATLDRTLAQVIAFNLGKTARRRKTGLLLATTHEDIAEDLQPDVHVRCRLDGTIDVEPKDARASLSGPLAPVAGERVRVRGTMNAEASAIERPSAQAPLIRPSATFSPTGEKEPPVAKKKSSASVATSNSRPARNGTGRTSLGGITAATASASSAG